MQPIITISLPSDQTIDFIFVEGGKFLMGDDDTHHGKGKLLAHRVQLSSFYIGQYLLTQSQWQAITGKNSSSFRDENHHVVKVSWLAVQDFIHKLNKQTGQQFRLPTEAEWEYAARGGKYSQGYTYAGSDKLKQVGWYRENSGDKTHEAGLMLANELGIYDMSGNVWEWCADWFDDKYYEECRKQGVVENPQGPGNGSNRVIRGGSYFDYPRLCCPTHRSWISPDYNDRTIGFRLVLFPKSVG